MTCATWRDQARKPLFSDLSGYTAMNEALDPEDSERVMSRIKSDAVVIVEQHGGLVNQFIGDGSDQERKNIGANATTATLRFSGAGS